MRKLHQWLVVTSLVLPTPGLAQGVTATDLVGKWVLDGGGVTLTLRADSTWTSELDVEADLKLGLGQVVESRLKQATQGRWRLSGDTLWRGPLHASAAEQPPAQDGGSTVARITLADRRLTLKPVGTDAALTYRRVD